MHHTSRTVKKDDRFFKALSAGATVSGAVKLAGYGRASVYEWRRDDELFAQRWSEADEDATERMEKEADRRAVVGVLEPVFYQGEIVGKIRKFSDNLLMFRLKGKKPEMYRDNVRQEITGAEGGPLQVVTWSQLHDAIPKEGDDA